MKKAKYHFTLSNILLISILCTTLLLQGCAIAALGVGGAATGVTLAQDRRSAGTIVDDQAIQLKATQALLGNSKFRKDSHVSVLSFNNSVVLVGQTPNEATRQQVFQAISRIPKVKKVYNEVRIASPSPLSTRSKDSWITTRIKAKMLANKTVGPTKVKVLTEEGVVYLMGLANREEELVATDIAQSVDGVNKVVQIFEHM